MKRLYDIVIYGATGFTGGLVAKYFASHVRQHDFKWTIAGRNKTALASLIEALSAIEPSLSKMKPIIANSNDSVSMSDLVEKTRLVISTVGPYDLYGEKMVKACVNASTHYVDITGEPAFVKRMVDRYHKKAVQSNTYIIHCCGFDSIPADLGVFYTRKLFDSDDVVSIKGYVMSKGTFSGGTWASALNAMSKGNKSNKSTIGKRKKYPDRIKAHFHFSKYLNKWALPMPVIDPWIVQRSSALMQDVYGRNTQYKQYFVAPKLTTGIGITLGIGGLFAITQFEKGRELLKRYRPSGEGPSEEKRSKSWFKLVFEAESSTKKAITQVSGGDPGYTETSKMLSESAITLLYNLDKLRLGGGVLTPAAALGDFLLKRLQSAGIKFEVLK